MKIKFMSVVQLPIYSKSHLSDIFLTIKLLDKKMFTCEISHINITSRLSQLSNSKGSIFRHPTCPTLYPLIGLQKDLACFILF